ncbi:MAG: hypothetical protein II899_03675 [Bacteroidales bacterium]|nr:hypothetical protein [Bacteroidales bacterium]
MYEDVCVAEQGLTAAEADSATDGHQVEVVDELFLTEGLQGVPPNLRLRVQATWVLSIAAMQRTSVKGCQRSDAFSIHANTVPVDADERIFT